MKGTLKGRAHGDMIKMYEHFHSYLIMSRKHNYHVKLNIPNNGSRGVQKNSFYYSAVKAWYELVKIVKHTKEHPHVQRDTDLHANMYFLSYSDILWYLYKVSVERIQINLNVYKYTPFCYKNALNFVEPRYSWTFFDSQPKNIFQLFWSATRSILLGLEKPELNQPLSQIKITHKQVHAVSPNTYSWVSNRRPRPLINFLIFFHPGHSYSNPLPRLLIIGESFQTRQTLWNNILILTFRGSRKRSGLSVLFCFVSSCKEANTLCFVL